MILSQPVIHEIDQITVPTVLIIGEKDTTAIGKDRAPPELAKVLGNYPDLGRKAHERIKGDHFLCRFQNSATRHKSGPADLQQRSHRATRPHVRSEWACGE